jgi:hypothetical protein
VIVPRKIAKSLFREFLAALRTREEDSGEPLDAEGLDALVAHVLDPSTLVLRGTENVEQKARRYLAEGRLVVELVDPAAGLVVASCAGAEGTYKLGRDPKNGEWRCTCPAPRKCSHLIALRLVVRL